MSQEFTPKEPRFVDSKAPFRMRPPVPETLSGSGT